VKTWHFLPFQRKGVSTYATFIEAVYIVPLERRPTQRMPFPDIKDWVSLRITLERTGCLGSCTIYKLTILGNGNVEYRGYGFVDYCGEYLGHVPQEVVEQLAGLFRNADYFNLFDHYDLGGADLPAYTTSIAFDGQSKSVVDGLGERTGMPESVSEIETAIDRLAGPKVWANDTDSHATCLSDQVPTTTSDVPNKIEVRSPPQ
jgi:hypothetical protein